jgi:hypothetical protein
VYIFKSAELIAISPACKSLAEGAEPALSDLFGLITVAITYLISLITTIYE